MEEQYHNTTAGFLPTSQSLFLRLENFENTAWVALKFPLSDFFPPSWDIYLKEWLQKCLAAPNQKALSKLKMLALDIKGGCKCLEFDKYQFKEKKCISGKDLRIVFFSYVY